MHHVMVWPTRKKAIFYLGLFICSNCHLVEILRNLREDISFVWISIWYVSYKCDLTISLLSCPTWVKPILNYTFRRLACHRFHCQINYTEIYIEREMFDISYNTQWTVIDNAEHHIDIFIDTNLCPHQIARCWMEVARHTMNTLHLRQNDRHFADIFKFMIHYCDVIMGAIASQMTSLTIVYSIVYWDTVQRKHQSSASMAFVRGIHRGPVNSPHKWPVTRKMFPFDDVTMLNRN